MVFFHFRREIMGNIYLKNLVDSWAETLTKEQLAERQEALADRIEQVSINQSTTMWMYNFLNENFTFVQKKQITTSPTLNRSANWREKRRRGRERGLRRSGGVGADGGAERCRRGEGAAASGSG